MSAAQIIPFGRNIQKVIIPFTLVLTVSFGSLSNISAHPWGGLRVANTGEIYFSYTSPLVGSDHFACVWKLSLDGKLTEVVKSLSSPSDMILSRSPCRAIFIAERTDSEPSFQSVLWQIDSNHISEIIPQTHEPLQFHLQAYAVNDSGSVVFAIENELFHRSRQGALKQLHTNIPLGRINLLAWGHLGDLYIQHGDDLVVRHSNGIVLLRAKDLKKDDPINLPFTGANILFDMVVDKDENTYMAYYGNRQILRITPDGQTQEFLNCAPWVPHGIDVYKGEIYILESLTRPRSRFKFWQHDEIIPRIRKINKFGSMATLFEYQ